MSIRSIIEGLNNKKQIKEEEDGNYITLGSNLTKEDAERIARDKGGTVVADDEGDEEKYSVIKKEEVR